VRYFSTKEGESVVFEHVFVSQTDIVGSMGVKLNIAAEEAEEADVFVAIRKADTNGNVITFHFQNALSKGPVALGWLRASHRALDPTKSTPDRPWHPHTKKDPLIPGQSVAVEVEVWPSATRFEAGERLQLVIRGSDIYTNNTRRVHETNNKGWHVISTGPESVSQLTFNVVEST
jgi:predicted acyl esterase